METRLRLAGAAAWFWFTRGHLSEGRGWLDRALARGGAPRRRRTKALWGACMLAFGQADYPRSAAFAEASLAVARGQGDQRGVAAAVFMLGAVSELLGDYEPRGRGSRRRWGCWRELGDHVRTALTLDQLGVVAYGQGELERAVALHEEALSLDRAAGSADGSPPWRCPTSAGRSATRATSPAPSRSTGRASIWWAAIEDRWYIACALVGLAIIAGEGGEPERAARLIGAIEGVSQASAPPVLLPSEWARYEQVMAAVRGQLGDDAFAAAHWRGASHAPLGGRR